MTTLDVTWLDAHTLSKQYLCLPRVYGEALGRLRWSDQLRRLVLPGVDKVVSYDDLALFLEGFAARRSLLAFGAMAHWVVLLKSTSADHAFNRLRMIFEETGENWRNAGALAGMMSEQLLPAAQAPPVAVLCAYLRDKEFAIEWFSGLSKSMADLGEEPPHALVEFEQHARRGLLLLADADLAQWLKSGRGPLGRAGEDLARRQPPPRVLGNALDELLSRPRLAGAASYVPQMVAAFSVPPRRQTPDQLPIGGYSDIVTHGSLDRLLPGQHALDDLEFLRRFCENEMFYFRREEPPAHCRQEVFIILDQGVRTWGDVRLVLTAAALALAQHAGCKALVHYLALTSRSGLLANAFAEPTPDLGAALEASDFSPHPGLALESVLEGPGAVPRDIFLLTHPYCLFEEGVQSAARRLLPRDRLFALTVSAQGDAELAQLRHGSPVRLKSFHVDFVRATTPAAKPLAPTQTWSGAIEPIGWPFRFGVDSRICRFDFSFHGKLLFAVTENTMIFAWNLADGDMEILPRPQTRQGLVKEWREIKGVAGGFALLGCQSSRYLVAHYDWLTRACTVHEIGLRTTVLVGLAYVRHCHSVVLVNLPDQFPLLAIDLATGMVAYHKDINQQTLGTPRYLVNVGMDPQEISNATSHGSRAEQALLHIEEVGPHTGVAELIRTREDYDQLKHSRYYVRAGVCADGSLLISDHGRLWPGIVPCTEGINVLPNHKLQSVRLAENTLAIQYFIPEHVHANKHVLAFYRGPEGHFLREINWTSPAPDVSPFVLSSDGKKFALQRSDKNLEVQYTDRPERILYTRPGGFGTRSRLWVGDDGLLLCCGRNGYAWHLLLWSKACLEVHSEMSRMAPQLSIHAFRNARIREFVMNREPEESTSAYAMILNDPQRWPRAVERNGAIFVLDRYSQVLVFNSAKTLVFQFFAHGDTWSAWLPDGTRLGRGPVHSWPNTPGALVAMGQALRQATGGLRQ
jgi:hypothetical protein